MKPRNLFWLCFLCWTSWAVGAEAQTEEETPEEKAELVVIGTETLVPIQGTKSVDGRFLVGWTIRPTKKTVPAVDWETWKRPFPEFFERYDWDEEGSAKADYQIFNYALDRKNSKLLVLPTDWPYHTHKNRGHLLAKWGEPDGTNRYAVIANDARFYTHNLWLVRVRGGQMEQTDLAGPLSDAVLLFLKKSKVRRAKAYGIFFPIDEGTRFNRDSMELPFLASIPKSGDAVTGRIRFRLPDGRVVRIIAD